MLAAGAACGMTLVTHGLCVYFVLVYLCVWLCVCVLLLLLCVCVACVCVCVLCVCNGDYAVAEGTKVTCVWKW